jgi:hypothetical protein
VVNDVLDHILDVRGVDVRRAAGEVVGYVEELLDAEWSL